MSTVVDSVVPSLLPQAPWLALWGLVAVGIALAWRFKEELALRAAASLFELVLERYSSEPERYADFVGRLATSAAPRMRGMLPVLMPVLTGGGDATRLALSALGGRGDEAAHARRVGEYLAVEYEYRQTKYVALLNYADGGAYISRATAIVGGNSIDVTARVKSYAGPSNDFHGQRLRPRDVVRGCESLLIHYSDGTAIHADGADPLAVSLA